MNQSLLVTKHDGTIEHINLDKIHRVLGWAVGGLNNASISQIELRSHIQLYDGIKTADIHGTIIKAAADLIPRDAPDYQYLTAHPVTFHLRKEAFDQFKPPALYDHVVKMVEKGKYDHHLLEDCTEEEFQQTDGLLNHWRGMNFSCAVVRQLEGKYLVQNRATGEIYGGAQFLYILVAACLFSNCPRETRLDCAERLYDAAPAFEISLPTPIMSGVCTPTRQSNSYVLIECDNSLDSVNTTSSTIVKCVSQRVGIDINVGRIHALGNSIRGGGAPHTGCVPFYKHFQTAVKSCSQGGARGSAAILFYPMWHLEAESLLVSRDNRGTDANHVRHTDYGIQVNKLVYTRLLKGGSVTLFSPSDVPGLYDAFFADQDEFRRLHTQYERDGSIHKQYIKAVELSSLMMQERASTGRIYVQNVDHYNTHSPFDPVAAPVRQSNLCLEIVLPIKPLENVSDEDGEIVLCTLSTFNPSMVDSLDELEELAVPTVRALDALLNYQDYSISAAKRGAMERRTLDIGVVNLTYYLARHGKRYPDGSASNLTHKTFETIQHYLLKASNELVIEQGARPWFNEITYTQGILPIDTYKRDLDDTVSESSYFDWEALRESIRTHGLRNSTLSVLMPSEISSQVSNAANSIEPPCGHVSIETSKDGILRQVVLDYENLQSAYELLWKMPNDDGYLQLAGIMQKFIDRSISISTSYGPTRFPSGEVPMQQLPKDLLNAYKSGVKTLYYHNTRGGAEGAQNDLAPSIRDDGYGNGTCKTQVIFAGWRNAYLAYDCVGLASVVPLGSALRQGSLQWHMPFFHRRKTISCWSPCFLANWLT